MRILAILTLCACSGGPEDGEGSWKKDGKSDPVDPVTVVEVAVAGPGSVAEVLTSSAVVESESSADLVPEATGVVREIRKDEGDLVQRGDVLAVLDNVSLNTGAARASAEVSRLEQQVRNAQELVGRGAISVREVEDLEHQLATARLSSREASSSFGSTRLTAPFDGVVAMRGVRVGELATSAKTAFQVVDPSKLRVVASLPERDLGRIALAQPARLVSAYDEDVWTTGAVQRVSPVVDSTSGTFRVTLGVDTKELGGLRPGQFVSVRIEVDRRDDVLVVPKEALIYEDGAPVVYVVGPAPEPEEDEGEEDDEAGGGWFASWGASEPEVEEDPEDEEEEGERLAATRTSVQLGLVDEDWVEITSGIDAGALVITIGHSHLRDGGRVRLAPDDAGEASNDVEGDKDAG